MNHSTLGAFRTSPDVTSPATCNFTTQVSTPELSSEHGAFLLNCSNRCSFAHPASYFLHSITLFTFFCVSLLRKTTVPYKEGHAPHSFFFAKVVY